VLEKLRLFLVVLEEGSFRRAAERLRISQSAITRQMQSLELDLGGRSMERTSAGVRPTNGGHALAAKAKTLLADYDSTMAEVRRLVRGESVSISFFEQQLKVCLHPACSGLKWSRDARNQASSPQPSPPEERELTSWSFPQVVANAGFSLSSSGGEGWGEEANLLHRN
jgi:molybdenum-dependent DNA-binding transcriptional regulator ModE